jgi:hypothetical protein
MKIAHLANLVLQVDPLHRRVDLQRPTAHVLSLLAVGIWAWFSTAETSEFLIKAAAGLAFAGVVRLLLSRMGASRLSALLILTGILLLIRGNTTTAIVLISMYAALMLLVQEYFLSKSKLAAVVALLGAGLLIAGADEHGPTLAVLFCSILILRTLWHAVVERLSKRVFVMFAAKSLVLAVLAPVIGFSVTNFVAVPYNLPPEVDALRIPMWAMIIGGLVCLRGFWATILLSTDRSPLYRPFRMFYVLYAALLFGLVTLLHEYGHEVFMPDFLSDLASMGLTDYGLLSSAYLTVVAGLLLSAGIDRTLYVSTGFSRAAQRLLQRR